MDARVAPSLFPRGWARDGKKIPPRGSLVKLQKSAEEEVAALRYALVLIAGMLAGNRVVEAVRAWREWHAWAGSDTSGSEAYRTFFLVNTAAALLSIGLAALLWHLLRPRRP
jgi:hypothetical protein